MDQTVDFYIKRERERALKILDEADEMVRQHYWDIAANRYYYACYHLVTALLIKNGVHTKTHEGLIRQFGLGFVRTGLVDTSHGAFLSRMEQLRKRADYNAAYEVTEDDVQAMTVPAHSFFEALLPMI